LRSDIEPSQTFVQLSKDGKSSIYVLQSAGNGVFNTRLNLGSAQFQEGVSGPGDYSLTLFIGDSLLSKSLLWELGHINLSIPARQQSQDDFYQAKHDIEHIFRPAEERPPQILALLFSALVFVPVLILLVGVKQVSWVLDIPSDPAELFYGMLFQGSLVVIGIIYVAYWLFFNIFQAGALLLLVSVVAVIFGSRALEIRHQRKPVASS